MVMIKKLICFLIDATQRANTRHKRFFSFSQFLDIHSIDQKCISLMLSVKSKSDTTQWVSATRHELDFSSFSPIHSVLLLVKTFFWNPKRKYRGPPIIHPSYMDINQHSSARHELDLHFLTFIWTWTLEHFLVNFDVKTWRVKKD